MKRQSFKLQRCHTGVCNKDLTAERDIQSIHTSGVGRGILTSRASECAKILNIHLTCELLFMLFISPKKL